MYKNTKAKKKVQFFTAIAAGLHLINTMISRQSSKGMLSSEKGQFFQTKQGKMFYRISGTGEKPLLLIHNASPIDCSYEWHYLEEELKKDFCIYTIDLLGCGLSDKPSIEYTNYLYSLQINDFIHTIIQKPVHVCSSGISSSFAVMAAVSDPSLYLSLTMINPVKLHTLQKTVQKNASRIRVLFGLPIIGTTIYHIAESRSEIEYQLKENYFYNPFLVQQSTFDALYESAHRDHGKGKNILASQKGGYLYWNIVPFLPRLDLPVYLLYGQYAEKEDIVVQEYASMIRQADTFCISNAKWMPHLEDAKAAGTWISEKLLS